jgi:hypothetical protein
MKGIYVRSNNPSEVRKYANSKEELSKMKVRMTK